MSTGSLDCRHVRLALGAEPQALPPDVAAHLATCADCSRFRDETLLLDGRLRAALELPLPPFRRQAPPVRRFAMAASVALALTVAGGFWVFRPQPALAHAVVEHAQHEPASWEQRTLLPAAAIANVLNRTGIKFDTNLPVVYAMVCPFRGRQTPHLVVQTDQGPLTVMLLAHEKIAARQEFSEEGFSGVLLPAGEGSVAVLTRAGEVPDAIAGALVSAVRWR
jgi:hypothetical protein